MICITWHLQWISIANNSEWRYRVSSVLQRVWCSDVDNEQEASSSRLRCREKEIMPQIAQSFSMHFQVVTLPLPFFPFRAHHTLNSNMCCCTALISSYMLYVNTVSHHSVLLGSVSRVGLMVRCFKNSLSVRTENNSSTPPCIISQPSYGHPANYLLRSIGMLACHWEKAPAGTSITYSLIYMTPAC